MDEKLAFWLELQKNVLLIGKHGVGKTTMVLDAFKRAGLKYLYFSASTMDPWVDFIGVPKEKTDENGNSFLDLVRPKAFIDGDVQAIFFDEYNRSHKKVRNAVMELIQFKSINGMPFPNLQVIWAAINPSDEKEKLRYDVEDLDPAQVDRFHVHLEIPYLPSKTYFRNKFDAETADAALAWWKSLSSEQKDLVSPRRLDYALEMLQHDGDIRDYVLPSSTNCSKLVATIKAGEPIRILKKVIQNAKDSGDDTKLIEHINDENTYAAIKTHISDGGVRVMNRLFPLLSNEKQTSLFIDKPELQKHVLNNHNKYFDFLRVLGAHNSSAPRYLKTKIQSVIADQLKAEQQKVKEDDLKFEDFSWDITTTAKSRKTEVKDNLVVNKSAYDITNTFETTPQINGEILELHTKIINSQTPTIERKRFISNFSSVATTQMSNRQACQILNALEYYANRSQVNTLVNNLSMMKVFNTCVTAMIKNGLSEHTNLVDYMIEKFPNLMLKYVPAITLDSDKDYSFVFKKKKNLFNKKLLS